MYCSAFGSSARPSVPEGLARLKALGAWRVTVLPYFLFPGVLPTRIQQQAEQYAAEQEHGHGRSALKVAVAGVIGDCDALADLVVQRYLQAQSRTGTAAGWIPATAAARRRAALLFPFRRRRNPLVRPSSHHCSPIPG